jgi:dehydrogenase/reductase SDR family protein 12
MPSLPARLADGVLEATIVPSFTKIGPAVRRRLFDWTPLREATGRRVVITGANSGLGYAGAMLLAEAGADVTIVARNAERGQRAVDTLVHNAGALHRERMESVDGIELTLATHVVGPFKLTSMLRPLLAKGDDPRIVTMASGGLYGQGLSLSDLQVTRDYSGTKAYARAKRAQLVLNEGWSEELDSDSIKVYTMHPGWADTPGVSDALPGFGKLLGPLLRSLEDGADTLAWLSTEPTSQLGNRGFWLDRGRRPEHRLPSTKSADQKASALWREISGLAGVSS